MSSVTSPADRRSRRRWRRLRRHIAFEFLLKGELEPARYLLQMTLPNVYFHLVITYAIPRHNGIAVDKMDFLGPINFVEA
jgi:hypothetical protein